MSHLGTSATRWQTQTASGATPIIERERALALIAERLTEARSHAGSICLVSGEAGIGKTSLIRHSAALDGDACRWGRLHDSRHAHDSLDYRSGWRRMTASKAPRNDIVTWRADGR